MKNGVTEIYIPPNIRSGCFIWNTQMHQKKNCNKSKLQASANDIEKTGILALEDTVVGRHHIEQKYYN